jgi:FkbM family methyltransferase
MKRNSLLKNLLWGLYSQIKISAHNPYARIGLNWLKIKLLKHLPDRTLRNWRIAGSPLWFYSPYELIHGINEIFIQRIYEQSLPQNAFILDCGANIGLSTIYLKKICPTAHIIAFEPDPINFELLHKNIQSFKFEHVELIQSAIWKENTTLNFSASGSMASGVHLGGNNNIQVDAVRLKDFLTREIDFLKIDIEGAEIEVLRDIRNDLACVKTMFLEYHGRFDQNMELLEMLDIVRKAGFEFYLREAAPVYLTPFARKRLGNLPYDIQLNIFCFRN